jgi:hypothetical protein
MSPALPAPARPACTCRRGTGGSRQRAGVAQAQVSAAAEGSYVRFGSGGGVSDGPTDHGLVQPCINSYQVLDGSCHPEPKAKGLVLGL